MSDHKCHAIGCDTKCRPEYLMCPRHWKMLPKPRQLSVLREYRAGQCSLDPVPSPQWHDAANAAIYWIHNTEQRAELTQLRKRGDELQARVAELEPDATAYRELIKSLQDAAASIDLPNTQPSPEDMLKFIGQRIKGE